MESYDNKGIKGSMLERLVTKILAKIVGLDGDVVHKTGTETITGQKAFKNNWPLKSSESLVYSYEKPLYFNHGTDYSEWTSAQKDGTHYRRWRIKFSSLNDTYFVMRLKVLPGYCYVNSEGCLEKMLVCRPDGTGGFPGGSFSNYTTAVGYSPEEYRINSVTYASDLGSYVIEVVSCKPTSNNNAGAILEVFNFGTNSTQQEVPDITVVQDIIEGWPSWAGDINATPKIQSNGVDVQDKLPTTGSGSSLKYSINIEGTADVSDKATTVMTTPLTTQSTGKYMATVDDNGNVYTGSAVYDMSSNTLTVNINGNANTAAIATNYNTSSGGIRDALAGKAALSHSHGFITASGTMASTDGTFEAGDKLLFIDHNYSGAPDMIRAVTNANGALYFNGTKLNFGTLGVAYGGTGNTNAKAACNSFLAALDEGTSDFDASRDPYVITGVNDASSTTSYYRRPVSKILSWIMAKIPVVGGAIDIHTCQIPYNYAEDHTSGNPAVDYIQYVDGSGTCYNVPCASSNLQGGGLNSDIRRIGLANGTTERTAAEMKTNGATGQIFRSLRFNRSGGLAVLSGAVCFRPIAYKVDSSGTTVLTESADWHLMVKASGSGKQFKGTSFQPVHAHAVKIHLTDAYVPTTAYGVGVVDDIGTNGIFAKLSSGGILSFTVDSNYDFANFQRGKFYAFSITVTCP